MVSYDSPQCHLCFLPTGDTSRLAGTKETDESEGACAALPSSIEGATADAELEIDENLFDGDDLDLIDDELTD